MANTRQENILRIINSSELPELSGYRFVRENWGVELEYLYDWGTLLRDTIVFVGYTRNPQIPHRHSPYCPENCQGIAIMYFDQINHINVWFHYPIVLE